MAGTDPSAGCCQGYLSERKRYTVCKTGGERQGSAGGGTDPAAMREKRAHSHMR